MREKFHVIHNKIFALNNKVGILVDNIIEKWLIGIRESNPAILDMFKDKEYKPYRRTLPWSGEFAGKYLTCASMIYSYTKNVKLKEYLDRFVDELISDQSDNGYIGPWPKEFELTGRTPEIYYLYSIDSIPETDRTWDAWNHYHIMYGLLRWYEVVKDERTLNSVIKIAELFCQKFYGNTGKRLIDIGDDARNLSPIHTFILLYEITGNKKYLEFAYNIEKDFETPQAGDYVRCSLQGVEYYQITTPRWERLHTIQGIAELYFATGKEKYKQAFEHIWWSIVKTDRHNTGGFSTAESAIGNPYDNDAIETCCTIAYMAMTIDMLRLTGNSVAADEMELSTYNASMGSFSPSGKWSTYNTPMEGYKRSNYHEIGFQCNPGSPDLNCCSVNAPRAFGFITDWAIMRDDEGLIINYYGNGTYNIALSGSEKLVITQKTQYPYEGKINISIGIAKNSTLKIKFRIPFWAENNSIFLNGTKLENPIKGKYYCIDRLWSDGDIIELTLDMSLHFWAGEDAYEGRYSIYRGPILLAFDPFYDFGIEYDNIPEIIGSKMVLENLDLDREPGTLFKYNIGGDRSITMCDLFTAGLSGNPYTTWFKVKNIGKAEFSKENPLRSTRKNE